MADFPGRSFEGERQFPAGFWPFTSTQAKFDPHFNCNPNDEVDKGSPMARHVDGLLSATGLAPSESEEGPVVCQLTSPLDRKCRGLDPFHPGITGVPPAFLPPSASANMNEQCGLINASNPSQFPYVPYTGECKSSGNPFDAVRDPRGALLRQRISEALNGSWSEKCALEAFMTSRKPRAEGFPVRPTSLYGAELDPRKDSRMPECQGDTFPREPLVHGPVPIGQSLSANQDRHTKWMQHIRALPGDPLPAPVCSAAPGVVRASPPQIACAVKMVRYASDMKKQANQKEGAPPSKSGSDPNNQRAQEGSGTPHQGGASSPTSKACGLQKSSKDTSEALSGSSTPSIARRRDGRPRTFSPSVAATPLRNHGVSFPAIYSTGRRHPEKRRVWPTLLRTSTVISQPLLEEGIQAGADEKEEADPMNLAIDTHVGVAPSSGRTRGEVKVVCHLAMLNRMRE